jgi:iron complex transport system ATP-binding protein
MIAARLRHAQVRLGGRLVLDAVTLDVAAGEVVGVVGANGAGKTTLLRALLGLAPLSAGEARLAEQPVASLSEKARAALVAYLPQDRRVAWNLAAWRIAALGAVDRPAGVARDAALAALNEVGLSDLADRGVLDMSGGERARVLLARLMATRAPLLVADEPAAGLDPEAQLLAADLLRRQADAGRAVLVTMHDLTLAARHCDRLAVLGAGRLLIAAPPREALTPEILATAFHLDGALIDTPAGPVVAARRLG